MSEPSSDRPQGLRQRFGAPATSRLQQRVVEGARPRPGEDHAPEEPERPAGRKKAWLIGGLAAVAVLILGGVALAFLLPPRGNGGQDGPAPGGTAGPAGTVGPTGEGGITTTLHFLPPQEYTAADWTGFRALVGDVDGDGRADLVWNLTASSNLTYVALAAADGSFTLLPVQERAERGWGGFHTLVGDVDGDGRADLVWNETDAAKNRLYVALGGADGAFTFLPAQDHPRQPANWSGFRLLVGDVDGDGRTDLIWNETDAAKNRLYVALGGADGLFTFLPFQDDATMEWSGFVALTGDVNGDGRTDLVWSTTAATGRVAVALAVGDGTWKWLPAQEHPEQGLAGYQVLIADVNGDGRADLVWNALQETNRTIVALANADGALTFLPAQEHPERGWSGFTAHVADVDGDGRADLVWNEAGAANRTYVGLGTSEGVLRFLPAQDHPDPDWAGYRLLVGDLNGDGRADLIWNATQGTNRIVVGLSRP